MEETPEERKKRLRREASARYRAAHKQEIAERNKRYRQENKELIAEHEKQYRQENKELIAERNKQYYEKNKERLKRDWAAYKREWRRKNNLNSPQF